MKHTKDLAYLRQLCCLGLPKETFIPEFLQAITRVIPSHNNTYAGIEPGEFKPDEISMPTDDAGLAETIVQVYKYYWTLERCQPVLNWYQNHPVLTDYKVFDENYLNSDLFNLAHKPFDMFHPLQGFITNHGKPVGAINLHRPRSQKPFDTKDQALFLHLLPYVNHALQNQAIHDLQYVNQGETGMLLLDQAGNILYQNATAARLWLLAHNERILDETLKTNDMLPQLRQLCRNLNTLFKGHDAPPPSFCHINGRGRFIFTAYWLDKANREPGGLVGVTIEYQEPQALKILRGLRDLPLSPTQKEVALLLAQGVSSDEICQRLHIKKSTLKDHIGKIFDKLDINRREELLPLLLARPETTLRFH